MNELEWILGLIGLVGLWALIAPIVALIRAGKARDMARDARSENDLLRDHLRELRLRIDSLESTGVKRSATPAPVATHEPAPPPVPIVFHAPVAGAEDADAAEKALHHEPSAAAFEIHEVHSKENTAVGRTLASAASPESAPARASARPTEDTSPPPLPDFPTPSPVSDLQSPVPPAKPAFDWEQFIGAKLFAWAGGFALFLCAAYGIKYSFDHDLIPPAVRAAFGFITGLALIIGGLRLNREKYAITQQSLAATGTLILYAVTFACASHSIWNLIPSSVAFGLMSVITTAAFLIAVRLDARVVAILGIAGGFLTPKLLSTGEDNPFGLFGYIALLNVGLLAVALRKRWQFLAPLGAVGTLVTQLVWWDDFYGIGGYARTNQIYTPMTVFLGMAALFTAAAWVTKRREEPHPAVSFSALALAGAAMFAAIPFVGATFFHDTPAIPFAYAFFVEAVVFALAACDKRIRWAGPVAGGAVFLLLGGWTAGRLAPENMNVALALYLAFAVLHTVVPLTLRKLGKIAETPAWCHAFPILALLLTLVPAFKYDSMLVWPLLLLVDVLAVVLAVAGALLWPILFVLGLTVLAAVGALLHVGQNLTGLNEWLLTLGGVSVAFMALGVWLWKKFAPRVPEGDALAVSGNAAIATFIPPISAILPFLLLIMATAKLPLADPSPVFGLALLLSILLLGLAKLLRMGELAPVGLAGVTLLEFVWSGQHLSVETGNAPAALGWHLGFATLFFAYPFIFHRDWKNKVAPWLASVASLGIHFLLFHRTVMAAWPHDHYGLHPLAFAVPAFAGLALVLKRTPQESPARLSQLALFGGTALAFITTIFPLEFENQWLTLAWAFEGAALLWLFRRVPHNGLRVAAFALLAATFARLAMNPAVLSYHKRGDLPILNWYLYTYGLAAAAFSLAARLMKPPANIVGGVDISGLLRAAAAVLGFLLLNIEIADFFSEPGRAVLTFDFSNNLPRDMSYSIGWGVFSLGMLVTGIVKHERAPRYAAITLLAVAFGKLFFHDLANLSQLYRIGAFFGLAVIGFAASFLYQKFLGGEKK
jgi:hypothetical protein